MTKTEAKELSLKVWRYLAEHPEVSSKQDLPFYEEITDLNSQCPLCEIYCKGDEDDNVNRCLDCPLGQNSRHEGNCPEWWNWEKADNDMARKHYAEIIVELIEGWEV